MSDYQVSWKIELEADSPEHAARRAYDAFCRPGSGAHVFEVTSTEEVIPADEDTQITTTHLVDIDHGWEPDFENKPVCYPMSREH